MKFDELKRALIGEWRGTKQLYLEPPPAPAIASPSKMFVKSVAGGSFLQFNYDWTYEGAEQSGLLLFGYDEENAASAAWVDSFHMSSKIMSCAGRATDESAELSGSYAAPPGPDWGWRITHDRRMIKSRRPRRRRPTADAFPGVQTNVMMVPTRQQKCRRRFEPLRKFKPEQIAIKFQSALQVRPPSNARGLCGCRDEWLSGSQHHSRAYCAA